MSDQRNISLQARTTSREPRPAGTKRAEAGIGTILVVEDDPNVRELAVCLAERLGYDVLEAYDGVSALAVLASGRHIDVLFTDIVMPGMNGVELSRQARSRSPSLKVVFASGYSADLMPDRQANQERTIALRKPYGRTELANALRTAMAGHQEPH